MKKAYLVYTEFCTRVVAEEGHALLAARRKLSVNLGYIYNEAVTQVELDTEEPYDFESQVEALLLEGLSNEEVLSRLDPDTRDEDMIALLRKLLKIDNKEM